MARVDQTDNMLGDRSGKDCLQLKWEFNWGSGDGDGGASVMAIEVTQAHND